MLHQQEGHALLGVDGGQPLLDVLDAGGVDAGGGLVEKHQHRIAHERHADLQQSALAAREVSRGLVAHRAQQQEVQQLLRLASCGLIGPPEEVPQPHVAPLDAQLHVLEHREVAVDADHLERPRHAQPGDLVRFQPCDVGPVEGDSAGVDFQHPAEAVEQRRLAAAVGTDEPHHLPGSDLDVHPVDRGQAAEALHYAGALHGEEAAGPRRRVPDTDGRRKVAAAGRIEVGRTVRCRRDVAPQAAERSAPAVEEARDAPGHEQDDHDQQHALRDQVVVE